MAHPRTQGFVIVLSILVILSTVPNAYARLPYEQILAGYTHNQSGVTIVGNITYSTESWYFDVPRNLLFSLEITIPQNTSVSLNVSRVLLFLDFSLDDFVYPLLNHTTPIRHVSNESGFMLSQTYSVTAESTNVDFIIETSNWAILGFLVCFNISISTGSLSYALQDVDLFSHRPEGMDWVWSSGLNIPDNDDGISLNPWHFLLFDWFFILMPPAFFAVLAILCILNNDRVRRWRASRPSAYINKRCHYQGHQYKLGGLKIALAYYMYLVGSPSYQGFGEAVAAWTKDTHGLDLKWDMESSQFTEEESVVWNRIEHELGVNAKGIDRYLYDCIPYERRGKELVRILGRSGYELDEKSLIWIMDNIANSVEEEIHGVEPPSAFFVNLRTFVESWLETLVPDLVIQLREAVEQFENQSGPAAIAGLALTIRDLFEGLLYQLVSDEMLPEGVQRPAKNKTRNSMSHIKIWLEFQLEGKADVPLSNVEKGFDLFYDYTKELGKLVHRSVHKDKAALTRLEASWLLASFYSWLSGLFILFERAEEVKK